MALRIEGVRVIEAALLVGDREPTTITLLNGDCVTLNYGCVNYMQISVDEKGLVSIDLDFMTRTIVSDNDEGQNVL